MSLCPGPGQQPRSVSQGNLRPEEALQALTIYEGKFGRLKDDRERCAKAKEALELTDTGLLSGSEERVQVRPPRRGGTWLPSRPALAPRRVTRSLPPGLTALLF